MDLLYRRYASPFILLELIVRQNRLLEFVNFLFEREDEDKMWELYLHHTFLEKNFNDWKQEVTGEIQPGAENSTNTMVCEAEMSQDEIKAAIQKSKNILDNFVPD